LQGQAPQHNKVSHEDTLLLESCQPSALSPGFKAISSKP
jgi:hypothetical protein